MKMLADLAWCSRFAQIGPVLHLGVVPMVFVTESSLRRFPIFQIARCVEQFQQGATRYLRSRGKTLLDSG